MLLAPMLLLGSDVIGRVVLRPSELQVGIVTAAIGAPSSSGSSAAATWRSSEMATATAPAADSAGPCDRHRPRRRGRAREVTRHRRARARDRRGARRLHERRRLPDRACGRRRAPTVGLGDPGDEFIVQELRLPRAADRAARRPRLRHLRRDLPVAGGQRARQPGRDRHHRGREHDRRLPDRGDGRERRRAVGRRTRRRAGDGRADLPARLPARRLGLPADPRRHRHRRRAAGR